MLIADVLSFLLAVAAALAVRLADANTGTHDGSKGILWGISFLDERECVHDG